MEKKSTSRTKKPAAKKSSVAAKKKTVAKKPVVKKTVVKKTTVKKSVAVVKKASAAKTATKKTVAPKKKSAPTVAGCYKDDKKLADIIAGILDGFNAKDVVVIDLKDLSPVTNFYVVATSNSTTHGRGVADRVFETLKKEHGGIVPAHTDGMDGSNWVILDYIGVVVHVLSQSHRDHFNLEGLWEEGKIKSIRGE